MKVDQIINNLITAERAYNAKKVELLYKRCKEILLHKQELEDEIDELYIEMDAIYNECENKTPCMRWDCIMDAWDNDIAIRIHNLRTNIQQVDNRYSYIEQQIEYHKRTDEHGIEYTNEINNLSTPFLF